MSATNTGRERLDRRRFGGTAAIEFGLGAPVLLILLMGLVEVGFGVYQAMQVQNAVEAGAVYASKNGWNQAGISAAVVNATGVSGLSAKPAPSQFCGCPQATGVVAIACASTCPGGTAPGQYVRISAQLAHETILPYPGLPLPMTLTAESVVRLK
jgi:Flp pilus assembly protein TadG